MMDNFFLTLINMSITASWLALAVMLLRLVLKRAPKAIICVLWALVAVRLVCPVFFESGISLIPSAETVPHDIVFAREPKIHTGVHFINSAVNPVITASFAPPNTLTSINPIQVWLFVAEQIWAIGIVAMLVYTAVSYIKIRMRVREAVKDGDAWICDRIDTPFILGVFRPRIYVPSATSASDLEYIIAHEKAHIRRRDYIWKPLGFALLTIYWFNPVLWIAYILLCRDIESACDEKVLKEKGTEIKKAYSEALINASAPRKLISACPLAFGETSVKSRVKGVLNYKKPAFWIIVVAITLCIATAVCFLTNPKDEEKEDFVRPLQNYPVTEIGGYDIYKYFESIDPIKPSLLLYDNPKTFTFSWSGFSSYIAVGKYELDENTLTLKTDDGMYTYVFDVVDDTYVFDASRSSTIPSYKYSADALKAECPVPDGAVFQLDGRMDPFSMIYDTAAFDIDKDGEDETVIMSMGPTSGRFTITFSVIKNNNEHFESILDGGNWSDFYFHEDENGEVTLCTVDNDTGEKTYYNLSFKDGYVYIDGLWD